MSDIIDIGELRKSLIEKTEKKDLSEFAEQQQNLLERQAFEIRTLREKNAHLEELLTSLSKGDMVKEVTPEELICLEQIQILKSKSSQRELSSDEAKRLDIYVRNLKAIRGDVKPAFDVINLEKVSEDDLIQIARKE